RENKVKNMKKDNITNITLLSKRQTVKYNEVKINRIDITIIIIILNNNESDINNEIKKIFNTMNIFNELFILSNINNETSNTIYIIKPTITKVSILKG